VPDVTVLSRNGQILFREGRPDEPGVFDPPVVVNPDPEPPARDLALVRTRHGVLLAALAAFRSAGSLYALGPDGSFTRTAGLTRPNSPLPVRIAAGDLSGDGLDDLVIATPASNQIFVFLQHPDGGFGPAPDGTFQVGVDPSDLALVDVNVDRRPDLVVT